MNLLMYCPQSQCGMGVILRPLQWRWSNNAGDELLECLTCGYATVYRVRTGQCEPRPGQPRDEWQPPVGWPRPRRVDAAAESSLTPIVKAVPASPSQHDPAQPGAELATDAGAATPLETPRNQEPSEDPENRQASDGSEGIAQQTRGGAPGNASSDLAAETPHQPLRPTGTVEAGNNSRSTARPGGDDRRPESVDGMRRPNGTGDARDPVRDRQGGRRSRAAVTAADVRRVLAKGIDELRANPDLDPVRRARALAQLVREHRCAIELQFHRAPEAQRGPLLDYAEKVWGVVGRVLAEEIEKLRANPDLDPVRRTPAVARLAREQLRWIELDSRGASEAQRGPGFDLVAMLKQALEEAAPELERRKQLYWRERLDAERAEMSVDEPRAASAEILHPDVR